MNKAAEAAEWLAESGVMPWDNIWDFSRYKKAGVKIHKIRLIEADTITAAVVLAARRAMEGK